MTKQLPPKQYADLLYKIIDEYCYPKVTYDFCKDSNTKYNAKNDFKDRFKNPHNSNSNFNNTMLDVEKYIYDLLYSHKTNEVENGLLNVLYWGNYTNSRLKYVRINDFYNFKTEHPIKMNTNIDRFQTWLKKIQTTRNKESNIIDIQNMCIPGFKSGISFTSKLLMFLNPEHYPVLDMKIAKIYARQSSFPSLEYLTLRGGSIPIQTTNVACYENWACWCRNIANKVNGIHSFSCRKNIRAVDVERTLFVLADSYALDARNIILAGPK